MKEGINMKEACRLYLKAFTLIELLVVIAIIALLLSILMPALQAVKKKASTVVCLTNTKNLSLGWYMYQSENDSKIMSSHMSRTEAWMTKPRFANNTAMPDGDCDSKTATVSDEDEIRGVVAGYLYPYLEDPDVYHCPGDKLRKSVNGDGGKVFVSYAIPACLNDVPMSSKPSSPADIAYKNNQIYRFTNISSPSSRYVFVETAEERNWTMSGHFVFGLPKYAEANSMGYKSVWWGPVAVNHGDSSVLGYADGHSEKYKWRNQSTIDRVTKFSNSATGASGYGLFEPLDGREDVEFMGQGWPSRVSF